MDGEHPMINHVGPQLMSRAVAELIFGWPVNWVKTACNISGLAACILVLFELIQVFVFGWLSWHTADPPENLGTYTSSAQ